MDEATKIVQTTCSVCGVKRNIEVHCVTNSYAYDNDDQRFTEEVCWEVCEDCLKKMEGSKEAEIVS